MRTRPGICARKRRFVNEQIANEVVAAANVTLRAYRCALCKAWHLTSRTKGMKLPTQEVARRKAMRKARGAHTGPTVRSS